MAVLMLQSHLLPPDSSCVRVATAVSCRRWRPAYLQPAADAERFGYLSGERGGIAAQQSEGTGSSGTHASDHNASSTAAGSGGGSSGGGSSSSGSSEGSGALVSPDNAVLLGLAPETGAPVFAADLGPPPPLLPDASRAAAAAAAAFSQVPITTSAQARTAACHSRDVASGVVSCSVVQSWAHRSCVAAL
jgi:hypothetical protein